MPKLRVNNTELYYEMEGSGPPVLLLHGLGSSTREWEYQVPALARAHRVIAMDVRGHGRSERVPGPYSVTGFARDAAALLQALEATPAHVVGLSMGGMIAFQLAVDAPEAVRSLTIVNSGPAMIIRDPRLRSLIRLRLVLTKLFGMRSIARMIADPLFPDPGQEHLRDRFRAAIAANDPRCYRAALRALYGWSVAERIGGIRCPVLIVSSDHDYTPVEFKREYSRSIPGARVVVIENSRHAAPLDRPEELNRLILEFFSSGTSADVMQAGMKESP
jgi:pimeloyl-ACP methyl ester carboxylesterase